MNDNYHQHNYTQYSELDLVERYKTMGDKKVVSELMRRYSAYIIAFAFQELKDRDKVKDFTQDLFLRLSDKLKTSEVQHFKSWLYTMMRNMHFDQVRRSKLHLRFLDWQKQMTTAYRIEDELEDRLDAKRWKIALEKLSEEERECIELIYLQEKDYAEIMQIKAWTFNQIRGYRQRGMRKLREMLNANRSTDEK